MKTALELMGHVAVDDLDCDSPDCKMCRDCDCETSCNCVFETLAKRAREEMRLSALSLVVSAPIAWTALNPPWTLVSRSALIDAIRDLPVTP